MHKHILSSYSYVTKLETIAIVSTRLHSLSYSYRFNIVQNGTYINSTFQVLKS